MEAEFDVLKVRLIKLVPFLKLVNLCSKLGNKKIQARMAFHHFFVENPALVRILSLNED